MRNAGKKLFFLAAVVLAALVTLGGFVLFDAFVIEPNWVTVRTVRIRNAALARSLKGSRLVQISDLHLSGSLGFRERSLIERINRLKPDLILITGDLVESSDAAALVSEFVGQLKPGMWSYGILGNSDCAYLSGSEFADAWKRAGLSLLGGRSLQMSAGPPGNEQFWMVGIDYPGEGDAVRPVLAGVPRDAPLIALAYSPDIAPALSELGADLILAGDTHGGQVTFPGCGRLLESLGRSRFRRGLYRLGDSLLYVNRGIGTKVIPARFLCPPEITLFQFEE